MRRRSRAELVLERRLAERRLAKAKRQCASGLVLKRIRGRNVIVPEDIAQIDAKYEMAIASDKGPGLEDFAPTQEDRERLQSWMRKVGLLK